MDYRIIKSPTKGTLEMLDRRRSLSQPTTAYLQFDAVGLIQGKLLDMLAAADVAEKAAAVHVEEIRGLCPQHFAVLAVFGDTASVEAALGAIRAMEEIER